MFQFNVQGSQCNFEDDWVWDITSLCAVGPPYQYMSVRVRFGQNTSQLQYWPQPGKMYAGQLTVVTLSYRNGIL